MSGHNKWTQIKRKKGAEDAKKSREFSLLARMITMEAKRSGGDRNSPELRQAIERARAANLPKENIERAVQNAIHNQEELAEIRYEAYGPGGAAIIIEGVTDNKNRTVQEIKHLLSEYQSAILAPGAVIWGFEKTENAWRPLTTVVIGDEATRQKFQSLVDALKNHADVQQVTTNHASNRS